MWVGWGRKRKAHWILRTGCQPNVPTVTYGILVLRAVTGTEGMEEADVVKSFIMNPFWPLSACLLILVQVSPANPQPAVALAFIGCLVLGMKANHILIPYLQARWQSSAVWSQRVMCHGVSWPASQMYASGPMLPTTCVPRLISLSHYFPSDEVEV